MTWLAQYFLNPGIVIPGLALASIPIIIHILSRLRYKRVRFAAMEFLLQSEELNRRRLILEQLLLLLLRVAAVILAALLLARLIMDPSRMLMLRGASVHHVVILDDSLSMRDRMDETTVFRRAVRTLEQMLSSVEGSSGAARVTVLLMTRPDRPIISDRRLDGGLLQEVTSQLRNLRCSYRAGSVSAALTVAQQILAADGGVSPQVHFISDLRTSDWMGRPEVTAAVESLNSIDATVSLLRAADEAHENVVLEQLSSESLAAARGVPWRMNLTVRNQGSLKVSNLRGSVRIDGALLPSSILFPELEAGAEQVVSHDITFQTEGRHQVEVRLDEDALPEDGQRFIAVDVTDRRPILIIDDEGQQEDAGYVSAALSADESLTGLTVDIRTSQVLSSIDLSRYDCIYLLNIRDLAADASLLLAEYVRAGGGIAWFPGEQANTQWYNETLRQPELNLFPVPLATVRVPPRNVNLPAATSAASGSEQSIFQSPVFAEHPIFAVYNVPDSPFADAIQIARWFQLSDDWDADDGVRADQVRTLARLRNGVPVIFEHKLGRGKVLTFLTGAGRRWSNWPIAPAAPGYVVMHLLMHPYLQKPIDLVEVREISESLRLTWSPRQFRDDVEVFLPEPDAETEGESVTETFLRLKAVPTEGTSSAGPLPSSQPTSEPSPPGAQGDLPLVISMPQADRPGIYRIRRFSGEGNPTETWVALNVPSSESRLDLADAGLLTAQKGMESVRVVEAGAVEALGGNEAGCELRWVMLGLLLLVLVAEQLLSLHMSYHPEVKR